MSLLLALVALAPTTQDLDLPALTLEHDPYATVITDRPGDGRLWARGRDWKMSFGPEGSVYHPRVGPDAPGTPLGFRVHAARVGERVLELSAPAPATVSAADIVQVDHGPLLERWILGVEQVEQTFVLDALPERGELVVELELDTQLTALSDGAGWRFVGPDGEVLYGAATAVDARGRSTSLETRLSGDRLELVVPAAFVAQAELPLVVDPVVSTGTVSGNGGSSTHADVTYLAAFDQYLVSVSEDYALNDGDVRVFIVNGTGSFVSAGSYEFDFTTEDWGQPRIGATGVGSWVCVAAIRRGSTSSAVVVRTLNTGLGTLGTTREVYSASYPLYLSRPDVAGDKVYSGETTNFIVAWDMFSVSTGISWVMTRSVNTSGFNMSSTQVLATAVNPELVRAPSLSSRSRVFVNHSFAGPLFLCAWERYEGQTDTDIEYAFLASNSAGVSFVGFPLLSGDYRRPRASNLSEASWPTPRTYGAIAFESHSGGGVDVGVALVQPGQAPRTSNVSLMEGMQVDHDQYAPTIGLHEDRIQLCYLQTNPNIPGDDPDVYMAAGGIGGDNRFGLAERKKFVGLNAWHDEPPAMAIEGESGGTYPFTGLVAWTRSAFVNAARLSMYDVDVAGSQYCEPTINATGKPGWMRVAGRPEAGGSALILRAENLPANQFGYFLMAASHGYVPFVGTSVGHLCLSSTQFGRFDAQVDQVTHGTLHAFADPNALPQANGTIAALAGDSWYFQAWYRDVFLGAPTSNLTNAVRVIFE